MTDTTANTRANGKRPRLSREKILDESAALFFRQGYRKTSLEDVTTRLGVTRPALYYWFKSKTEILVEIQRRAMSGLTAAGDEVAALDLPPRELFWAHVEAHARYVAANATEVALVFEEEQELPEDIATEIRDQRRAYTDHLVDLYGDGEADSEERRIAVNAILGAATWVYRWYRPSMGPPADLAAHVVHALRGAR